MTARFLHRIKQYTGHHLATLVYKLRKKLLRDVKKNVKNTEKRALFYMT